MQTIKRVTACADADVVVLPDGCQSIGADHYRSNINHSSNRRNNSSHKCSRGTYRFHRAGGRNH